MVWGAMSWHGVSELSIVQGTMRTGNYIETLQAFLLPKVAEWYGDGPCTYQQDNAPCHKSLASRQFLQQQNFAVMDWPAYSPDMSPIENLWAIVKQEVHASTSTSKVELVARLRQVWASDRIKEVCKTLIEGMHRRTQALVAARGGVTKY